MMMTFSMIQSAVVARKYSSGLRVPSTPVAKWLRHFGGLNS
jgi:hypothetical protein